MKAKGKKILVGTILVAGLTIGAVSFVMRHARSTAGGGSDPVANVRQGATAGPSVAGTQANVVSGRYTGATVNVYYGYVKVQAVVKNGKLQNVVVLEHPNDNGTSRYINSVAMPYLVQEAVQAQSAHINLISGATFSSMGFVKSLGSALSAANM